MMLIKVRCGCGQKYAFDVEPVDGAMGSAVQCPVCGVDGTKSANEQIAGRVPGLMHSGSPLRFARHEPVLTNDPPIPRNLPASPVSRQSVNAKLGRKRLLQAACGGVVLVLVGAVLVGRSIGLGQKSGKVAAAEKDGLPHTLAELNTWYVEPPEAQNAATFFSEGIKALHIANVESSGVPLLGKGKLPSLGSPLPASVKVSLATFVGSNREALRLFAQGAKLDQSRYPVDLSLGVDAAFPHLNKMKEAGAALELAALVHADANDLKSSAADLSAAFALARSLSAEPYMFSQFVRARLVASAVAGLEQSLNRTLWSAEASQEMFRALQKMEEYDARGEGFNRSVIAERVTTMALLKNSARFLELLPMLTVDMAADRRARMAARLQSGKLEAEEVYFDQALGKLLAARQQPFPDRLKTGDLVPQQIADAASKQLVLDEFLLSGLRKTAMKEAECLAYLRVALTATALEQFRAEHDNHYPASLAQLTPAPFIAIPADPYDGQPLRYKTKDDGYILYSIGPELKDGSGQSTTGKEANIAFTVVTSAKPRK